MIKTLFTRLRIAQTLFFLFFFSIPFGTKKFLLSFTGGTSEFDSVFLFLTDILFFILCLFIYFFFSNPTQSTHTSFYLFLKEEKKMFFFIAIFCFFSFFSIFFSSHAHLSVYFFIRLFFTLFQCLFIFFALKKKIINTSLFAGSVVLSALTQALIGIFQFLSQKSVGVWFLGESAINEFSQNVARFSVFDVSLLRTYGTMAHANILAGFLVLGLISCMFLWVWKKHEQIVLFKDFFSKQFLFRVFLSISFFVILVGLVLTFSRSGWIVALCSIFLSFCVGVFRRETRHQTTSLILVVVTCFFFIFFSLGWVIFPRATLSLGEPSVNYRILYNNIGKDIIFQKPLGVGIGNEKFFSEENGLYKKYGIENEIDYQPIHNLYLLIASEIGIFGLFSFLSIIFVPKFFSIFQKPHFYFLEQATSGFWFGFTLLFSVLVFGLFDHFLWTLESGRLMLWLVLGIMMGESTVSSS
jgi:hypothetical protein